MGLRTPLRAPVCALLALVLTAGCDAFKSSTEPTILRYPLSVNPGSLDIASGGRFQFAAQGGDPVGDTYTWSLPDGGGELEGSLHQWQTTLVAGPEAGRYRVLLTTTGGRSAEASFQVYDQYSLELVSADPPAGSEVLQGSGYITFRWRYVIPASGSRPSISVSFLGGGSQQAGGDGQAQLTDPTGIGVTWSTFTAIFACQPCVVETTAVRAEVTRYNGERLYAAEFPLRYIWK